MADGGIKVLTVSVDDAGMILVRCPACVRKHTVSVAKFQGKKTIIKVRCHCGELFALDLEFRKSAARHSTYSGRYENCSQGSFHGQIQITTITDQGMEFTTQGRSTIHKGDKLKIDYQDSSSGFKKIRTNVIVQSVQGTRVSCYFAR